MVVQPSVTMVGPCTSPTRARRVPWVVYAVVAVVFFSVLCSAQAFRAMLPSTRSAKVGVTATALQSSAIHWQRRVWQEPMSTPALSSAPPELGSAPPVKQWDWAGFAQLPTHIIREATWYDQERTLPALFEDVPEGGIVWMSFANAASLRPSRRDLTRALAHRSLSSLRGLRSGLRSLPSLRVRPGLHAPAAHSCERRPSRR